MKICPAYHQIGKFWKDSRSKDGLRAICAKCDSAAHTRWQRENRQVQESIRTRYIAKHPNAAKESSTLYAQRNPDKVRKWEHARYERCKSAAFAKAAMRRARRQQAAPQWLSKEQIANMQSIYDQARRLSAAQGVAYHVDHIVPLNNPIVCGLHVPWNLQILSASANLSKGNRLESYEALHF